MTTGPQVSRTHLPIPSAPRTALVTYDAKDPDTPHPLIRDIRPPEGAPNILVVLLDDVGFGAASAFGGPCATPTAERLAAGGLKYNRFHTTALCSPTRQALLTGRNHHSAGMGGITEIATGQPGYNSVLPNTMSPIARTLKLNGYNTAQFGKCHEVPVWQTSQVGPFDAWPSAGGGFEHFYGFIGGEANQWYPSLYEGTTPIEVDRTPEQGYHLTEDLADKAIAWIGQQKALAPDKPFFTYFAPGATHAPHHAPKDWIDKYRGKFDAGWDALREQTFARQKELGVIPQDAELTPRPEQIPAWDDMPEELKPVLRRQMEVYAGFLEHTDHHVGRVIDALDKLGILDDTLVYYIVGDNGASAEGTFNGTFNEMLNFNGMAALETPEFLMERLDEFGGPDSYNHYAVGWAHAMCTPYQWTKQVASHWGGTRNGTVVHWPNGFQSRGEHRDQFHHVIDVAPTLLEAAGIPEPLFVNGVQQAPIEGTSMLYSFNDGGSADRHETQYFEMFGNRGIYHKGWTAVTKHKTPWVLMGEDTVAFDDDVWELYDTTVDWTQAKDLSKEQPQRLHQLQRLWLIEATRFNVLPLDDNLTVRMNPDLAGRPTLIKGNTQVLFAGMGRLSENCVLNLKNKSHSVTAEIDVPEGGAEGVIVAQGANIGGWSLYAHGGKLKYCYNLGGLQHFFAESAEPLPSGAHQVRMEFAYDGPGLAKGGTVTLFVDGAAVGTGQVAATLTNVYSADDGLDVGADTGSAVSPDYRPGDNRFTGRVRGVQLAIAEESDAAGHQVDPAEAVRIALARQ
ncbi:arylsulfatase [Mycobacteroides abscessus]|uniref:arylsulfatase n=1 Tax=Mycobacteroides abscessus TaxID=36809 RepID=UPI00092A3887|nr:arylsulfatase [Mycobacteroides abscessus]SIJ31632.1 arylsulfatase [Mycobacteroides abscessus subsp. abscessus]SIK27693.1 arylsulfatase [Mycobacteroides abscessus subsp. abscessus]SIL05870.1 arylsulfatase [Mycobacteroides abscessus subsp. abscessus]SLF18812.1 arylsulfatase [Mycobacteroides abscessus subsp. abscessus]SLH51526.1 arylsulfatase [Mycobacteroides abscessus subsp. abscessus]